MKYSKGICWIGDCRIPFVDNNEIPKKSNDGFKNWASYYQRNWEGSKDLFPNQQGRFTPNLLVCDDMLNDGVIGKSGKNTIRKSNGFNKNAYGIGIGIKEGDNNGEYGDSGSSSRYYDLDKWFEIMLERL